MHIVCFSFVCLLLLFLSVISAAMYNCYPAPGGKGDVNKLIDWLTCMLTLWLWHMRRAGATWPHNVVTKDSWSQYHHSGRCQDDTQQYASTVLRQFHLTHSGNVIHLSWCVFVLCVLL